jgi:hypothetical protein
LATSADSAGTYLRGISAKEAVAGLTKIADVLTSVGLTPAAGVLTSTNKTTGVAASGIPLNDYIAPITEEVKAAVINTPSGIDAILEYTAAATERANAFALLLEQQTAADIANFNAGYLSQYTGTKMGMENGVVITINDNTSGLIEIVQDAVVSNNRYGNTLVPHGAIANP